MAKRPRHQRPAKDYKRQRIAPWPTGHASASEIATRVRYVPSGEHKAHPSPQGTWTVAIQSDKSKCDNYPPAVWNLIQRALEDAIKHECTGAEFRGDFPARAWAFVNDILHEARLTNEQTGEYHAFPLDDSKHHPIDRDNRLGSAPRATIPRN